MSGTPGPANPLHRARRRTLRRAAIVVGAILLLGAVAALVRRGAELQAAFAALRHPDPAWVAALVGAILASVGLTTFVLRTLLSRAGRVEWLEMAQLVCAGTLGNFAPLQPGLVGRVAYHHLVNRIAVRSTVLSMLEATLASAAAVALVAGSLVALEGRPTWQVGVAPAILPALLALAPGGAAARLRPFALALLARVVELWVWGVRSAACFALVGQPVSAPAALAFGCIAVGANTIPFLGNGLGVREWAVGLLATPIAGCTLESGLAAELLGRAAELLVFVPLGLACGPALLRRVRAAAVAQGGSLKPPRSG
ncbi:MAG: hypothetical protein U0574_11775 [Phycisphaerales bacterium]